MRNMRNETTGFTVYLKRFSGIIGAAFGTATLAIGYATKVATDFEYALVKLGNVTAAGSKEMTAYSKAAMNMGAEFGYGATAVVKGMTYLGQAGFTVNEIMSTMPTVLKLATVANMELEEAANNLAIALRSFNMDVSRSAEVASTYAIVADATQTSIEGITTAMRYVSPIASAAGWSLRETASAIGLMSQKGYDASIAGTALRGALTRILNPSREASTLMKDLGFKFKDANGKIKSSVELVKEFERVQMSAGLAAELFGDRASAAVIGLANTTVMVGDVMLKGSAALEYMNKKAAENTDYIDKSFARYAETTKIKWDQMMSSMQNLGIELGQKILPYIKDFLSQDLSPWLKQLQDWVKNDAAVEESIKQVYAMFKTWAYFVKDFFEQTGPSILKDFIVVLEQIQKAVATVVVGFTALGDYYKALTGVPKETSIFKALAQDASDLLGATGLVIDKITELTGLTPIKLFPSTEETKAEAARFSEDFWTGVEESAPDILWGIVSTIGNSLYEGIKYAVLFVADKISTIGGIMAAPFKEVGAEIYSAFVDMDVENGWEAPDPESGWGYFFDQQDSAMDSYLKQLDELGVSMDQTTPKVTAHGEAWEDVADQFSAFADSSDAAEKVRKAAAAVGASVNGVPTGPRVDTSAPVKDAATLEAEKKAKALQDAEDAFTAMQAKADANTDAFVDRGRIKIGSMALGIDDFVAAMASKGGTLKTEADRIFSAVADGNTAMQQQILEEMEITKEQVASIFTTLAESETTALGAFNDLLMAQTMTFQSESVIWGETFMGFFGVVEQGLNQMVGSILFGGQSIGQIFKSIGQQMVTSMVASFIKIQMQHLMTSMTQRVTEQALSKAKQDMALATARVQLTANATAAASAAAAWAAAMSGPAGATAAYATTFASITGAGMAALGAATAAGGILGAGGKVGSNGLDMGGTGLVGTGAAGPATVGGGMVGADGIDRPMASGGIVMRPTRALVGEAGPEAVIPLDEYNGGSPGGVTNIYNINVLGSIDDAAAMKITEGIDRVVRTRDARLTATTATRANYVDGTPA
jgi:TP901 family phage tail tape measure protein